LAEEGKMIILILTLVHEHFWFEKTAVALPVPSGIFHKVAELLTFCPYVSFKQVVEQIVSGFSTGTEGCHLIAYVIVEFGSVAVDCCLDVYVERPKVVSDVRCHGSGVHFCFHHQLLEIQQTAGDITCHSRHEFTFLFPFVSSSTEFVRAGYS
jgi:hypothetical protein